VETDDVLAPHDARHADVLAGRRARRAESAGHEHDVAELEAAVAEYAVVGLEGVDLDAVGDDRELAGVVLSPVAERPHQHVPVLQRLAVGIRRAAEADTRPRRGRPGRCRR
jgi:hypothetical protein